MHILKTNLSGNTNIGLFCFCNDTICLVPFGTGDKIKSKFEEVLKVPVYEVSIAGTSLIGVFVAGNSNNILIPEVVFESEKALLDKYNIKYKVVNTNFTAFGNNMLCNDNACVLSSEYDNKTAEIIGKALNVKTVYGKVAGLDTIGAAARISGEYGLVHSEIAQSEKRLIEKSLKVKLDTGSVNFGSPYISSGLICNRNGFIIGESTSGPEIANADAALGFIKG